MKIKSAVVAFHAVFIFAFLLPASPEFPWTPSGPAAPARPSLSSLSSLPVSFVENRGQFESPWKFQARQSFGNIFFAPGEIVFQLIGPSPAKDRLAGREIATGKSNKNRTLRVENICLEFVGANPDAQIEGLEETTARCSYFLGRTPGEWVTGARTFGRILVHDIYPAVDLIILGDNGQLKSEYRVRPGGRVDDIKIRFSGIGCLQINEKNQLEVKTAIGSVIEDAPVCWQIIDGEKRGTEAAYAVGPAGLLGFKTGPYEKAADLVIDPVLMFSTFLGASSQEEDGAIAVDTEGSVYVTGHTYSSNFPTTTGAYDRSFSGNAFDTFVTKLNSSGSALVYSTFLGGNGDDAAFGIAVDVNGSACVCGYTESTDFPATVGSYDTALSGVRDAFLTKLNAGGTGLVFSTFLGGTSAEEARELAVSLSGNIYLTGLTDSADFPTTPGAYDNTCSGEDAFLTMFNSNGSGLVFSTFFGGSGDEVGCGIVLHPEENIFLMGTTSSTDFPTTAGAYDRSLGGSEDLFMARFNSSGNNLFFSTYLGGNGVDSTSGGLAVDSAGHVYVTGYTESASYPTTAGAFDTTFSGSNDAFVTKINPSGSALVYSTFLGGSSYEYGRGIGVDAFGQAVIVGYTRSTNWPTTPDAYDAIHNGDTDLFLTQLNTAGTGLLYSTYVGGSGADSTVNGLALDSYGNAYVVGKTTSGTFPTTAGAYDGTFGGAGDSVVLKFFIPVPFLVVDGHDFNGNFSADPAVFRPTSGLWYIKDSGTFNWGVHGDLPACGNYDADPATEIAVWRPSEGIWYISGTSSVKWGTAGDIPVPHDYNGGGISDIAVWRPADGIWYIKNFTPIQWGMAGDVPVPGDYNANGIDEVAVWRSRNGIWYIRNIGNFQWGMIGDVPVPADYNGDGKIDLAVWRPSEGVWYIQYMGGGAAAVQWGSPGDVPVPGDYNADGRAEPAVWRPVEGTWFIYGGATYQWGQPGDIPSVR